MVRDEESFEDDSGGHAERPSRSARKRAALAAQRLGESLLRLKPADLAVLVLPDELRAALEEARRLTSRAALARQRQYIGRLMRDVDPEPLRQALAAQQGARGPRGKMR
jgi:ribosome-associated protein